MTVPWNSHFKIIMFNIIKVLCNRYSQPFLLGVWIKYNHSEKQFDNIYQQLLKDIQTY